MTDPTNPTSPRQQYRARYCPEGFVSMAGLCQWLGIDKTQARKLLRQKRLPEPIRVPRGSHTYLFFSIDLVRGKMGAQTSLTKQRPPKLPKVKAPLTVERLYRLAKS